MTEELNSTGYGPRRDVSGRSGRLIFEMSKTMLAMGGQIPWPHEIEKVERGSCVRELGCGS